MIWGKAYDPFVAETVGDALTEGGVFVDVGANFGLFTIQAARMPNTKVLAFEPSLRERTRLARNLTLNRLGNVVVFPFALGDSTSVRTLRISDVLNPGLNTLRSAFGDSKWIHETGVFCERFSRMISPEIVAEIKLVKIDVEGFEMAVLAGFADVMGEMRGATFVVEVAPSLLEGEGSSVAEMYRFFEERGFAPKRGIQQSPIWDEAWRYNATRGECNVALQLA